MSHTHRRRRSHTPHNRGAYRIQVTRQRPHPVDPTPAPRTYDQRYDMVTDHAIVRWMSRVVGIDLRAKFVADLLPPERAELASTMKSGKLRVNDTNVVLVIRGGVVASVMVDGAPD